MQLKIADTSAQDVALTPTFDRRRWLLVAVGVITLVVVFVWLALPAFNRWTQAETSVSGDRLRLATVVRGDFVRDISVQGRVVAGVSPTLYGSQTGTVTFSVEAGDRVEAGAVLATIDSPEVTNQLDQERASLQRFEVELARQPIQARQQKLENQKIVDLAGVQLTAAQREARRADQAFAKDAISQIDFEKAHDELSEAELAHKHALADAELDNERLAFELKTKQLELDRQALLVRDLERQVDELTIRAPVSGIVGNLLVQQKTSVVRNQPILSVVDLTQFEIEVQVPESYANDLAIGMAAQARTDNVIHPATLVSVSPEIIDNQVTGRLRFDGAPPQGLRQNQRLTTRILLEARDDVVMVTRGQFLESGAGRIAYVVSDGIAKKRAIEVGARSLNTVEILRGLEAGEEIIVSSTDAFEGAQTVLITN